MNDFEKRREEYLNKLREKPEIISRIVNDNEKTDEGKRSLELLLAPSNDRELDVAEVMYSMTSDLIDLIESAAFDEVKEIPLEENIGLAACIKIINGLKKGEEIKPVDSNTDIKEGARILYDFTVGFLTNAVDTLEYMAKECGFDIYDDVDQAQFAVYMEKAKRIMDKNNGPKKDLTEYDQKEIDAGKVFASEFHRLCEEGKIKEEESSLNADAKKLVKLIMQAKEHNKNIR